MKTNWLKTRRKHLGLTQEELAAQLQLLGQPFTPAAVSHWETGRFQPPLNNSEFRTALSDILKMDIGVMLHAAGYEVDTGHTPEGEQAAYIIDRIAAEDRLKAVKMLETYFDPA
ncbi:MAG: helix-turn-helix domain-containing protein [Anaerolineae bacterium]|nr:helix-turn-helix domain-containing protein [Anaerolineae bacterium]